jgi:hypothetical protein
MKAQLILALVLVTSAACTRRDDTRAGDASTTGAELPARQPLPRDDVPPPPPATALGNQPATRDAPPPATGTTAPPEVLPEWVPEAGRLTVVQAPDLARNLGLVDGSTPLPAADAAP